MSKPNAKVAVRKCLRALTDTMVRNLMEHAANRTPILSRNLMKHYYEFVGAGCPAFLAGTRRDPREEGWIPKPAWIDAIVRMQKTFMTEEASSDDQDYFITQAEKDYYAVHAALTDAELRRLWIAEGKRRGYALVDA